MTRYIVWNAWLLILVLATFLLAFCQSFIPPILPRCTTTRNRFSLVVTSATRGMDDNNNDGENDSLFRQNSTMATPDNTVFTQSPTTVVRKKKSGHRVATDQRDRLPFAVRIVTPDPYTHPERKRQTAARLKKRHRENTETYASSLYSIRPGSTSLETYLGDFSLDKLTTTGDLLLIGDTQYKVVQHKCQYKYVGGKRFEMVRKVLEVKEVGRQQTEEYLARQWQQPSGENESNLP